jgi:peptidoglycan/LPS O-acetylase OafA/YrhL
MVIAGALIGMAGFVLDPLVDGLSDGWSCLLPALACSMMLIPSPFLSFRDGSLFPYNSPSWSLFLEYLANIVYAVCLCKLKKRGLLILACLSAGWIAYSAWHAGWLINGWDAKTVADGFPRVTYSFIAGLLVFRFRWIWNNKFGFLLPFILLLAVFFFPHTENDWLTETLLVVTGFPLIVGIGAGAAVTGKMQRLCLFIGRLSYPLYMSHITSVWIFRNFYARFQPEGMKTVAIVGALIVCNLLFAYLLLRLYDEPVRAWLTRKRKRSKPC